MNIVVERSVEPAVIARIQDQIYQYNMAVTGDRAYRPLYVMLRDEQGEAQGGLLADLWGGWMHLTFLWVADEARGRGFGTRMLLRAEDEARAAGCRGVYLETHSFQARPFYEKLGYSVIASLPDYPPGHSYYILRKFLTAHGDPADQDGDR
jgi:GNAT superfamily N-acetyltransferase